MKKTGKALSLVLSLALVVSSLTTAFASAAVTKTEYLGASDSHKTINLVNGKSGDASKTDVSSTIPYSGITGETVDHLSVGNMTAQDAAMSGGRDLVTCTIDSNTQKVYVSLKDSTLAGSETLAIRYTATNHRYTAPSQDILFSVVKYYTINVHKLNGYEVNLDKTSINKYGSVSPDGKNMTGSLDVTVDQYILDPTNTGTDQFSKAVPQNATNIEKNDALDASTINPSDAGIFLVKVSSSNKPSYTTPGTDIPVTLTAPTGADFLNQGGLIVYAVQTTTDANNKVVLNTANTITASISVTNTVKLDSAHNAIKSWHGSTWAVKSNDSFDEKTSGVNDPLNSSIKIPVAGAINVTGADIILGAATTMDGNAIVGTVTGNYLFSMSNGYAKSVDVSEFDLTKGTVGAVIADQVKITGGTAGAITAVGGKVTLDASDAKVPTVVGAITAKDIDISSKNASVSTGAIKMTGTTNPVDSNAAQGGTLNLYADKLSTPSIDFDHYNATLAFNGFTGSVAAPANAENGTISVLTNSNTKSNATLTGAVNVKTIMLTEGALNIASSLKVDSISGAGTLTIPAGQMFVNSSITGISLKLSDAKLAPGMTVFSATSYKVYDGMFTPIGFTIDYDAVNAAATNRTTDVFKIKTVVFAGLTITPVSGTSNKVVKGTSASFKVSSYPAGQALPDGTKINIDFSGSTDNFSSTLNSTGDTITINALKYDDLFASLNKGTITATLVSTDTNTPVYTYPSATYDVQMIAKPETSFTADSFPTTMKAGQQYTVKITSADGTKPVVKFANDFAVITKTTTSGNATFVTFTAKTAGESGVYISGNRAAVIKVAGSICDTTTVTKKAGQPYTFKVTSLTNAAPTFVVAGIGSIKPYKVTGHDYYYMVKATTNKGVHGVYVNGAAIALYTFA